MDNLAVLDRAIEGKEAPPLGGYAPAGSSGLRPPPAPDGAPTRHPKGFALKPSAFTHIAAPKGGESSPHFAGACGPPVLATLAKSTPRERASPPPRRSAAAPLPQNQAHQKRAGGSAQNADVRAAAKTVQRFWGHWRARTGMEQQGLSRSQGALLFQGGHG